MAGLEWPSGEEARKNVQIQFCPAEFPVTAVVLVRGGRWFESRRLKVFFEMQKGVNSVIGYAREYKTTACTVFVAQNRSRELVAESKAKCSQPKAKV